MFNIREIPKTIGDMGFCVLGIHEHMVDVGPIFVPEVYRGFGLARRLLGEAEKIARREGKAVLESWVLKKNNDSNLLFESMGYTRTDPRPRGDTYQWVKKMGEAE
jgi:GNAT superfamily N-acetyltransferase